MSTPVKTSACVDCATTIIGERLRCPVCHADHAAAIADAPLSPSEGTRPSFGRGVVAWVVLLEILAVAACALWLVMKGCTP